MNGELKFNPASIKEAAVRFYQKLHVKKQMLRPDMSSLMLPRLSVEQAKILEAEVTSRASRPSPPPPHLNQSHRVVHRCKVPQPRPAAPLFGEADIDDGTPIAHPHFLAWTRTARRRGDDVGYTGVGVGATVDEAGDGDTQARGGDVVRDGGARWCEKRTGGEAHWSLSGCPNWLSCCPRLKSAKKGPPVRLVGAWRRWFRAAWFSRTEELCPAHGLAWPGNAKRRDLGGVQESGDGRSWWLAGVGESGAKRELCTFGRPWARREGGITAAARFKVMATKKGGERWWQYARGRGKAGGVRWCAEMSREVECK
ncbi:hypothetical protein Drorol1_Dr00015971 [Drosera rotundifolia]